MKMKRGMANGGSVGLSGPGLPWGLVVAAGVLGMLGLGSFGPDRNVRAFSATAGEERQGKADGGEGTRPEGERRAGEGARPGVEAVAGPAAREGDEFHVDGPWSPREAALVRMILGLRNEVQALRREVQALRAAVEGQRSGARDAEGDVRRPREAVGREGEREPDPPRAPERER